MNYVAKENKPEYVTYLKLSKVLVDVFHIFTAEHGVLVVICVHISDSRVQNDVWKCLTEVSGLTAWSLHWSGGCWFQKNLEQLKSRHEYKKKEPRPAAVICV